MVAKILSKHATYFYSSNKGDWVIDISGQEQNLVCNHLIMNIYIVLGLENKLCNHEEHLHFLFFLLFFFC